MDNRERVRVIGQELRTHAYILGGLVLLMWLIEIVDRLFFRGTLDVLGVRPRTLAGLWGIFLAPFLHAGFAHLIANTLPFIVLGWFVMLRSTADFFVVTGITAVVSGLGIWLTGPNRSVHIGASGLIFGYFGFLLWRGYFERSAQSILWAIFVGLLYGGLIWGVLPQQAGISWQAHLFGFIGGAVAAYVVTDREMTISGHPGRNWPD